MIRFECPSCGKVLKAPDGTAARKTSCPRCGQRLRIPPPVQGTDQTVLGRALPDPNLAPPALPEPSPAPSGPDFDASPVQLDWDEPPARPKTALVVSLLCVVGIVLGGFLMAVGLSRHQEEAPVKSPRNRTEARQDAEAVTAPPASERPRYAVRVTRNGVEIVDEDWEQARHIVYAVLGLIYVTTLILILAWVAKDARARGVDGAAMWVLLILLSHVIGLLVYMASRPQGPLVVCTRCGNKRLQAARICQHCGMQNWD